jgi:hypothetical protein
MTTNSKQLRFYVRDADANPYTFWGSMTVPHGDVDYENHARAQAIAEGRQVMVVMGENFAYTFIARKGY